MTYLIVFAVGFIVGGLALMADIKRTREYKKTQYCYGAIYPPVYTWSPYCHDQPIMQIRKRSSEPRSPLQKTKEDVIMKTKIKEVLADAVNKQLKEAREKNCNRCIFATCENCEINKSMSDLVKEAILFDGDVEITVKAKGVGVLARSEE